MADLYRKVVRERGNRLTNIPTPYTLRSVYSADLRDRASRKSHYVPGAQDFPPRRLYEQLYSTAERFVSPPVNIITSIEIPSWVWAGRYSQVYRRLDWE